MHGRTRTDAGRQLAARKAFVPGVRGLQLALAAFWTIDALLQLQPPNFTSGLVLDTILGNAENQPQPISGSLAAASHLLAPHAVALNIAIILVQLLIAAGLVWRRTVKPALAVSVAWALGVWWLGEGFGGIFAGKATLLVGAPGPALLYALLALVAWPAPNRASITIAGAGALGERATRRVWVILWVGGAILRAVPFWFPPVYALAGDFQLSLDQEPHWLFEINEKLSRLATSAGLPLVIALAVLEGVIGLGVLTRYRRAFLLLGMIVAGIYWAFGQQFAQLFTGDATDVGAGPLYILLALTLWPRPARDRRRASRTCRSSAWRGSRPACLPQLSTPGGGGGRLLGPVEFRHEVPHPPLDLVAQPAHLVDRPALGVRQVPVDVALARKVRACVATPHRDDHVGVGGQLV